MLKKMFVDYLNKKRFVRGNLNKNDMCGALHKAWGYVFTNFMRGDYIEFGVYKGNSLVESYRNFLELKAWVNGQLKSTEPWRVETIKNYADFIPQFHGLDTFEGLPENEEGNVTFRKGNFLGSLDEVKMRCEKEGLKAPQLHLYKGLFKDTKTQLHKNIKNKAAIINIDCDLYASAKDVMDICEPLIQVGTVLLFDDYNSFSADDKKGERRAFREFRGKSQRKFEPWFSYFYVGQAFLCVG
jgi:O-methyltransferase